MSAGMCVRMALAFGPAVSFMPCVMRRVTLRGYIKILRDRTQQHEAEVHREEVEALRLEHERQTTLMRERSRIAHELHDTLAGGLTGIVLQLTVADDLLDTAPQEARPRILRARDIARESLAEARRTVQALRPHALQAADLPSALSQLAEQTTADSAFLSNVSGTVRPCSCCRRWRAICTGLPRKPLPTPSSTPRPHRSLSTWPLPPDMCNCAYTMMGLASIRRLLRRVAASA